MRHHQDEKIDGRGAYRPYFALLQGDGRAFETLSPLALGAVMFILGEARVGRDGVGFGWLVWGPVGEWAVFLLDRFVRFLHSPWLE